MSRSVDTKESKRVKRVTRKIYDTVDLEDPLGRMASLALVRSGWGEAEREDLNVGTPSRGGLSWGRVTWWKILTANRLRGRHVTATAQCAHAG